MRPSYLLPPNRSSITTNPRPEVPQGLLYSRPGFQILGDGTVLIAKPSDSTDGPTHAHRLTKEVLRREDAETREFILKAIENNRTGIDISALREELRLNSRQMEVLLKSFGDSHLRQLSAERPPSLSSPQAVVEAFQREGKRLSSYLSMRDVLKLAKFAAEEIERRSSGTQIPAEHQTVHLYNSIARDGCFKGRTLDNDPLLHGEMGVVEIQVDDHLANAKDGLAPLLNAPARLLDKMLSQATSGVPPLPRQRKKDLAKKIETVYGLLLAQCLSPDDKDGPQRMHHVLQHHVRVALDMLESEDGAGQGLPTSQQMQSADRVAEPTDSSKKRKAAQLGAPAATELSIEQSRQQARADELNVSVTARAMLTGEFELQQGLRCLQHAFNNGWSNWLALNRRGMQFVKLSLPNEAQELGSIDFVNTPDGSPMQRLRLMPGQLRALMPELETHLDLAIVFKGPTNLHFRDSQVHQTHHYTALIKVNGVHFELESLAANVQAGKRWLPNLRVYLEGLQGGAYMAIRGADDHPLSKYVKLMAIETFWKTCEAIGVLRGEQPIIEFAKFLPVEGMQDAVRHINADFAAHVCRIGLSFPHAKSHETDIPDGNGRSKAIVNWLNTLGTNQAVLWTGTDPMVMAVERVGSGDWFARRYTSRRSLPDVLDGQQLLFEGLAPDVRKDRAGFAQALTLLPPVVHAFSPALAQSAVHEFLPMAGVAVSALPRPGKDEVARSEQVLLDAFKMYRRYQLNIWTNVFPKFKTSGQIINYVLEVKLDNPKQFKSLLTISHALSSSNPSGSQHVAVLYLLRGGLESQLLELLPSRMPPCLVPYTEHIQKNVLDWPNREKRSLVLARLGIRPIIDLT
jgi:hypothetical protein